VHRTLRWGAAAICAGLWGSAQLLGVGGAAVAHAAKPSAHRAAVVQAATPTTRVVLEGSARFEVLTPRLIRLEYSATDAFENAPTMTAVDRDQPIPAYTATVSGVTLTIKTSALTLTYLLDSGPFTAANLTVTLADGTVAHPSFTACGAAGSACSSTAGTPGTVNPDGSCLAGAALCAPVDGTPGTAIGAYTRELVSEDDTFFPEHPGFLDTAGWYLLDDTGTAILNSPTDAVARPTQIGTYQDGYFFGYGTDYTDAVADFSSLTGPPPLLDRWAYGPWFSRYYAYSTSDYETSLIPAFHNRGVPLDGLVIDTNFKAPDSWNGWSWDAKLFPDPTGFLKWAAGEGLHVVLNIHPSIDSTDPHFAATMATADGDLKDPSGGCEFYRSSPTCYVFDWAKPDDVTAFMNLQTPFLDQGVSSLWLDWCCDASEVSNPGLTPDAWINQQYAQLMESRGQRGWVLSRIGSGIYDANGYLGDLDVPATGAWADHRSAIAFTGDATSDFTTLAREAVFTPGESAAIDEPYISNDIGGYSGNHLADDLYVRWLQLGLVSPIMRLHSNHGDRLPWDYSAPAAAAGEQLLRLRERLIPYLYDTGYEAVQTGMPLAREMVFGWPTSQDALAATSQWMLGDSLLAAPIVTAGTTASRTVWFPPGRWTDWFTGQTVVGAAGSGSEMSVTDGFSQMPLYIKAGGIVPLAPPMLWQNQHPLNPLNLRVATGAAGSTSLYEDAGSGLGYEHGQSTQTPIAFTPVGAGGGALTVSPAVGAFPGQLKARGYVVNFMDVAAAPARVRVDGVLVRPARVPIKLDLSGTQGVLGSRDRWSYDAGARTLSVEVVPQSTASTVKVTYSG
jgi:hypothetical protein